MLKTCLYTGKGPVLTPVSTKVKVICTQKLKSALFHTLPANYLNSMQCNPSWHTKSSLRNKEILRILQKLSFLLRFFSHNCSALLLILSQINPLQILPYYWFKIYFNIILLSICRSSKWSLLFRVSHKSLACILYDACISYVQPISSFLIWSPEKYFTRCTVHWTAHYAVVSSLLSFSIL